MLIMSSLTYTRVVPNLYEFLSSIEHKRRFFKECWLHSIFILQWISLATFNCLITNILQNILFLVQRKKKVLIFG